MPEARGIRKTALVRDSKVRQDQNLGGRTNTLERGHGTPSAQQQVSIEENEWWSGEEVKCMRNDRSVHARDRGIGG